MNTQKRGPLYRHEAQGTRWETSAPTCGLGLVPVWFSLGLLLVALGVWVHG